MNWSDKEIFLSGGSGSLGQAITKLLLENYKVKGVRIFSRGELLQWEMRNNFNQKYPGAPISYLIGDILNRKRVEMATREVDIIIHCAALKQVPVGEDNPLEVINTNIVGSQNILYAALENKVEKVMAISTDKACLPTNLYGATKMCAEKLFIQAGTYSGGRNTRFSVIRYGNVLGSRGSVIPLFIKQYADNKKITVTHKKMTRFWITLNRVAQFIVDSISEMQGEEIFIPKMGSATIDTIAKAVVPKAIIQYTGIRPGEKLHETLITAEESVKIAPPDIGNPLSRYKITNKIVQGIPPFEYRSDTNDKWLSIEDIKEMLNEK